MPQNETSIARARLRGQIGRASALGHPERADELRGDLLVLKIKDLVAAAPPLTDEQRERLAGLLLPPKATPRTRKPARR